MAISVWPLESDSNVIHQDLFFSFLNNIYTGEGGFLSTDLQVSADVEGVGVKVALGGAVVGYNSAPGGKRVFYNSAENKSGPNEFINPAFAVDLTGWTALGGSTVTRDTGIFHTSPASAKIVTGGSSTFTRGITLSATNMRVNPSQQKEISCWINAPIGVPVKLRVIEYNAALAQVAANETILPGLGGWNQIKVNFTTNVATRFIKVEVSVNFGVSVTFYVDDFEMSRNFDWIAGFCPANPTLPRIDRLIVQIRDQNVAGGGDTATDGKFNVITGIPTSGATLANLNGAAAVPDNSFLIANVLVPAAATVITNTHIDNAARTTAVIVPPNIQSDIDALEAEVDLMKNAYPKEMVFTAVHPEGNVTNLALYGTLTYILVPRRITVNSIALEMAAINPGGCDFDVGIYKRDEPNTEFDRVWSSGSETVAYSASALSTRVVLISAGSPTTLVLDPGVYWIALVADSDIAFRGRVNTEQGISYDTIGQVWQLPATIDDSNVSIAVRGIYAVLRGA
jgi:hypothetical protein